MRVKDATITPTFYDFVNAVASDRLQADRMLQENPDWIRERSSLDETALHYLVVENYGDAVRYLLYRGADVEGAQEYSSPLTDAARLGHAEMVTLLVEYGANLERRDLEDKTPLLLAAQYGYAEICDLLLAAGADLQARDISGHSIRDVALPRKREQIEAVLLKYS